MSADPVPTTLEQAREAVNAVTNSEQSLDAGVRDQVNAVRAHALATLAVAEQLAAVNDTLAQMGEPSGDGTLLGLRTYPQPV